MTVLIWIFVPVVLLFGVVLFFGPPYLPSRRRHIQTALDLLDLQSGQTMLELGSGDGRVMAAAARRGLNVVGIELNPLLVIFSWLRLRRYRKQVRVIWGGYFSAEWPPADGIFTFMIQRQMERLDRTVEAWRTGRPVKLASVAFQIPGKKPARHKNGVLLYDYKER